MNIETGASVSLEIRSRKGMTAVAYSLHSQLLPCIAVQLIPILQTVQRIAHISGHIMETSAGVISAILLISIIVVTVLTCSIELKTRLHRLRLSWAIIIIVNLLDFITDNVKVL